MSRRSFVVALSMVAATVGSSSVPPAASAQRADDKPFPVFEGRYFGQAPPGMVPQRFAPGFVSTAGYDITPTFSPALDEVFFGHRPTEEGSDNKVDHSRMVNGNTDIYWVDARVLEALRPKEPSLLRPMDESSLLVGVASFDPLVLTAASSVLGLAVIVACQIPVRCATRVAPTTALRVE